MTAFCGCVQFGGTLKLTGTANVATCVHVVMTSATAEIFTDGPATIGDSTSVLRGTITKTIQTGTAVTMAGGTVAASTSLTINAVSTTNVLLVNAMTVTGTLTLGDGIQLVLAAWTGTGTVALDGCTVYQFALPLGIAYCTFALAAAALLNRRARSTSHCSRVRAC